MQLICIILVVTCCLAQGDAFSAIPMRIPTNRLLKSPDLLKKEKHDALDMIEFINRSPEPFHVVQNVIEGLEAKGFTAIDEECLWKRQETLKKGGKYYFTRNRSSILAFTVGNKFESGNGFKIIGAHTDSPNLKCKPRSKRKGNGSIQIAVETYGGGLWHTWFDRDLSLAGRVIIKSKASSSLFEHKLVKIDRPILRIPNLAIHLATAAEREAFKVNKEDHLVPILCQEAEKGLSKSKSSDLDDDKHDSEEQSNQWTEEQQPELLSLLSEELSVDISDIVDFELSLYDTQSGALSGLNEEYAVSARIDNLCSVFTSLQALIHHSQYDQKDDSAICMAAYFDHEECGSTSAIGGASIFFKDSLERIHNTLLPPVTDDITDSSELFKTCLSKSFVLSVDMAHAIHPNYATKHEKNHQPTLNSGIVIKTNQNQRYATNGVTGFLMRELGRRVGIAIQEFVVRNDCACGSTIGPMISSNSGVRAVDLGMPQLSMHSIREVMGTSDIHLGIEFFKGFYKMFDELDGLLKVDKKQ